MLPPVNGHTQAYLDNLARIQTTLDTANRQISSGVRVGVASDDPSAIHGILGSQSAIGMDQQIQRNLDQVKAELDGGDTALQQAAKLLDDGVSIASEAGSGSVDPTRYGVLLESALAMQKELVGIASTKVNGRYIFSGDRDTQPLYSADPAAQSGVQQLATATSTMRVVDRNGEEVWRPRTATEIFDSGDATSGNVFAAVGSLVAALRANDPAAAAAAADNLKTAGEHLNQQLGFFGIGENRVADARTAASKAMVSETQELSAARDTDVPAAAIQLSQAGIQQQAALSVGARLAQHSLFDMLA